MTASSNQIATYSLQEISQQANTILEIRKVAADSRQLKENMFLPHRRNYYFFFLVTKGSSMHWVDFISYRVQPHHLYFTLPHQVHLKERSEPTEGLLLAFTEEILALCNDESLKQLPVIKNSLNKHDLIMSAADEQVIGNLLYEMLEEFQGEQSHKNAALQAYIKLFLVQVSRLYTKLFADNEDTQKGNTIFIELNNLLDGKIRQFRQPADYADVLNITVAHLNAVTKQQSGKTITELIQERFILEAKRLLFHSEISVKEIAYLLNFDDASYFNRLFKKLAGITPAEFRRQSHEKYH